MSLLHRTCFVTSSTKNVHSQSSEFAVSRNLLRLNSSAHQLVVLWAVAGIILYHQLRIARSHCCRLERNLDRAGLARSQRSRAGVGLAEIGIVQAGHHDVANGE